MTVWLAHWLGLSNASGAPYLFWSGCFADVTIFAAAIGLYRKNNCHHTRCWRIGHFDAGHFKVCKVHHPDVDHTQPVTAEHIDRAHRGGST